MKTGNSSSWYARDQHAAQFRQGMTRLHSVLGSVLKRLGDTAEGQAFRQRAVEVSAIKVFEDAVDLREALAAHLWILERADGDGLPLTAAGYLKPAAVQELMELLPTMHGWLGKGTREIDAFPLLRFREQLKQVGLLRNYKGSLRLSKLGREALANPERLWQHLSEQLVRSDSDYVADASVVIMIYAATTDGELDQPAIARTLTLLGWEHRDGTPLTSSEVYPVWNELWVILGNLSPVLPSNRRGRALNSAARLMINEALFTAVE